MLNEVELHPKSVLVLATQKIEIESIYDHTDNYNKTRFTTNLPQKYSKTSKIRLVSNLIFRFASNFS